VSKVAIIILCISAYLMIGSIVVIGTESLQPSFMEL
jgi:hypothetical protein